MRILNLAKPDQSDIKFRVSSFPDGQQTVDIENAFLEGTPVKIYSRMNSFRDLELIICANQAVREMGASEVHLFSPYFLGARSDRKFAKGGINYLKTVICPIINTQNFNSVTVLDPHSDVLEACLNNFKKIDNLSLAKFALIDIDNKNGAQDRVILVSPDAGALKKVYNVAEEFGIENLVIASKHRDIKTGKITHTEISGDLTAYGADHKFVIFDDICDGGRTFTELSKEIRKHNAISEIYLVITHGLFSAGLEPLRPHFTRVYTTDSIQNLVTSDGFIKTMEVLNS
jgi:ribose-phosphate pyrophosphokinase